jgi:hypothetical protein
VKLPVHRADEMFGPTERVHQMYAAEAGEAENATGETASRAAANMTINRRVNLMRSRYTHVSDESSTVKKSGRKPEQPPDRSRGAALRDESGALPTEQATPSHADAQVIAEDLTRPVERANLMSDESDEAHLHQPDLTTTRCQAHS